MTFKTISCPRCAHIWNHKILMYKACIFRVMCFFILIFDQTKMCSFTSTLCLAFSYHQLWHFVSFVGLLATFGGHCWLKMCVVVVFYYYLKWCFLVSLMPVVVILLNGLFICTYGYAFLKLQIGCGCWQLCVFL